MDLIILWQALQQAVKTPMNMIVPIIYPIATIENITGCQKFAKERVDIVIEVKCLVVSICLAVFFDSVKNLVFC